MSDKTTGVALSLTQSVSLWTILLPPLTEIRQHTPGRNPAFARDVRHAEMVAAALAMSIGGVMGFMEKDSAPFVAAVLASAAMTTAYEYTLQTEGHRASLSTINTEGTAVNHD